MQEIIPNMKGGCTDIFHSLNQSLAPDLTLTDFCPLLSEYVQHENKTNLPHPFVISNFHSFKDAGKMYIHLLTSTLIKILISIEILVATFLPALFPGEVIYRI